MNLYYTKHSYGKESFLALPLEIWNWLLYPLIELLLEWWVTVNFVLLIEDLELCLHTHVIWWEQVTWQIYFLTKLFIRGHFKQLFNYYRSWSIENVVQVLLAPMTIEWALWMILFNLVTPNRALDSIIQVSIWRNIWLFIILKFSVKVVGTVNLSENIL